MLLVIGLCAWNGGGDRTSDGIIGPPPILLVVGRCAGRGGRDSETTRLALIASH